MCKNGRGESFKGFKFIHLEWGGEEKRALFILFFLILNEVEVPLKWKKWTRCCNMRHKCRGIPMVKFQNFDVAACESNVMAYQ